jgi:hypothetical protein
MTISLTLPHNDPARSRLRHGSVTFVAAVLIAIAAPVPACEKASPALMIAKASTETRAVADFTGEFSSGAPVYRLPSLSVIGHREADVAKTQRVDDSARSRRSRANAATLAPAPNARVETASRDVNVTSRCSG